MDAAPPPTKQRKPRGSPRARGAARKPYGSLIDARVERLAIDARIKEMSTATGAGRYYQRIVRAVTVDQGGAREMTAVRKELTQAFAGCAALIQSMNVDIALGGGRDGDVAIGDYATLINCLIRLAGRIGLDRRAKNITTLDDYLKTRRDEDESVADTDFVEGETIVDAAE